jgi:hypothetical protein
VAAGAAVAAWALFSALRNSCAALSSWKSIAGALESYALSTGDLGAGVAIADASAGAAAGAAALACFSLLLRAISFSMSLSPSASSLLLCASKSSFQKRLTGVALRFSLSVIARANLQSFHLKSLLPAHPTPEKEPEPVMSVVLMELHCAAPA